MSDLRIRESVIIHAQDGRADPPEPRWYRVTLRTDDPMRTPTQSERFCAYDARDAGYQAEISYRGWSGNWRVVEVKPEP